MRAVWIGAAAAVVVALSLARGVRGYAAGTAGARRLPGDTVPEAYAVHVAPDVGSATFAGRVEILVRAATTAPAVVLNARGLVLDEVAVADDQTDRDVGVRSWDYAPDADQVIIRLDRRVLAGRKYVVRIRFAGPLSVGGGGGPVGFFRTSYTSGAGEKKWLAATQFKATHARSAFPCYDEPSFKTPFKISILIKKNEIALSNMPILYTDNGNETNLQNGTWVHFKETPPISVHSVAYFVGEYECLDKNQHNLISVYSHLGTLYQAEYINGVASGLLGAVEDYTSIKYTLPKLDLLALPELDHGAIESWGLNMYREKMIFVDRNTKTKTIVSVKMMSEHLMANHWFGNLVTPVSWDYEWLSEGFATYLEYFATATLEPTWRLDQFFVIEKLQTALEYDQNPKHPLSASVRTPKEIDNNVFDKITSDKGAAILRMLESWVGEVAFEKAVNLYLTQNQYNVVRPIHLWNAFDQALYEITKSNLYGENFHTVMDTWTDQIGYPVVYVSRQDQTLVLTQKRFSISSSSGNDIAKWFICTSFITNKDKDVVTGLTPNIWLTPTSQNKSVSVDADVKWYIFNIQSTGFYRVNYPEDNWLSLIKHLNDSPTSIHVLNRAQLIDDSFNLARAGQLNYTVPLSLIQYLDKEDDIIPWYSAMNGLNYILDRMRRNEKGYTIIKTFVSKLAGIAFQKVSKLIAEKQEPQNPAKVGWDVFSIWACKLDDDGCTKTAMSYFRRWRYGEEIPADIKDAAFCAGIKHNADKKIWYEMLNLYKSTKTYSEKESALNALACTDDVQLIIANLKLILDGQCPIAPVDYGTFFEALSKTSSGITALTFFIQNNFNQIIENVKNGEYLITTIYSILAPKVSTDHEMKKMSEIANATTTPIEFKNKLHPIYNGEIMDNAKWFESYSITIQEFVSPGSTTEMTTSSTTVAPKSSSSSVSSKSIDFKVILEILIFWVSVKFVVSNI